MFSALLDSAATARARRDSVVRSLAETRAEIQRLEVEETLLDGVAALFRHLVDQEVALGVKAVEQLQTEGLQAVFNDQELHVRADIEVSRGKVSVDLITRQKQPDGSFVEGLGTDSFGGSVLTVESILLRLIVILRRGLRPLLLLDETLPAFDSNYIVNMAEFLSTFCEKMGMDVLVVTHNPALFDAASRAYRVVRHGEDTEIVKVR